MNLICTKCNKPMELVSGVFKRKESKECRIGEKYSCTCGTTVIYWPEPVITLRPSDIEAMEIVFEERKNG